jgi:26S proteasome regulatory subunit N9
VIKAKADYTMYYKTALLFLACVDSNQLSAAEKLSRAYDLALSALLGDTIYNFGELVSYFPLLASFFILFY